MKNFLFNTLLLCLISFFTQTAQAQAAYTQTADDETALKNFWKEITTAYETGDNEKMWAAYTENAAEITPDGQLTSTKKALRENWTAFMKMADEKPKFTYSNPEVRLISADMAIATWDSEADIKVGGQQIGGKVKGVAFLHKIKGRWFIEFDAMTPVIEMHPVTTGN